MSEKTKLRVENRSNEELKRALSNSIAESSVTRCSVAEDVDTEGTRAGDEAERRIGFGEENHSQKRPFPWLSEQAFVSSHRWRSQLSQGNYYSSSSASNSFQPCIDCSEL